MSDHGTFPFGQPNTARPLRQASSGMARALVVGVYPSAFHVRWSPPAAHDDRPEELRRHAYVASLAVDVEPTVFWDGMTPSAAVVLEQWKVAVNFTDAWGTVQLGHNGPSGDGLNSEYLAPLGLGPGDVAMTDVVPWFFVKQGAGSQGAAIERLRAFEAKASLGIKVGKLLVRPSPKNLVEIACGPTRRESLRHELVETAAPLGASLLDTAHDTATGDLDTLLARRELCALVAHARTDYEVVKGKQQGIVFDALQDLERQLNADFAPKVRGRGKRLPLRITIVPVAYDELLPKLLAGEGDFVASPLLVTEAAAQRVNFTDSFFDEAQVLVVTRSGDVLGEGPDALSGRTLHLRASSGAWQLLLARNVALGAEGRAPVFLKAADEHLSDDELLEMVDAGLLPATVTWRFRARTWAQVFTHLQVNDQAPIAQHQRLALAVRPGSPKLLAWLDRFVKTRKTGTRLANIERRKYFRDPRYALKAIGEDGQLRFEKLTELFRRYADRCDIDYLLLMAQG